MNPLERAVIEAARTVRREGAFARDEIDALMDVVDRLDAYERSQDPRILTIPWRQVVAGDELKSVKTGRFYPVTETLALARGQVRLTVAGKQITRPTKEEPEATVRRGPDGQAVDVFVSVFSSGGQWCGDGPSSRGT